MVFQVVQKNFEIDHLISLEFVKNVSNLFVLQLFKMFVAVDYEVLIVQQLNRTRNTTGRSRLSRLLMSSSPWNSLSKSIFFRASLAVVLGRVRITILE